MDNVKFFTAVAVIFMVGISAIVWLMIPVIDENRHIIVKDKCCTLDNTCYIIDTNGVKYIPTRDYMDLYEYIQIGKGYTVHARQLKFQPMRIEKALVDDPYNLTCEAKGLC